MPLTAEDATALPGPDWLRARRADAYERFAATPLPTDAEEVWRYSRIAELDVDRFGPAAAPTDTGVPAELQPVLDAVGERAALLVVRNGAVVLRELDEALAAKGVVVGGLDDVVDAEELLGATGGEQDAFTALNEAFLPGAAVVDIPRGVVVERPIVVLEWVDGDSVAVMSRTIVRLGEAAQATVVDVLASTDVDAFVAPVVELQVADAAVLRWLGVQDLGRRVWQVGYHVSRVGRDATLSSANVVLGGDYARVRTDSRLVGQGGSSNLLAVYFGEGGQMHDFRTLQDHDAPRTTSDLLFKGAVEDQAQSVYSGLIRIRKGAAGTNAYQTNRNLVLSEGAHADSVPNLEIEENDVRCSHASAVGPIDADQRYYLESRGVPTDVAERLIVLGFFDEILERTPVPGLRELLRGAVAAKLGATA
ncbi:MAG: Fe-S cluster assembly protein SufD [Actinomycetota bacterium]|nr:Fe-S cluster assembly protein SufD [Actinomycetota bacterium]